VIPVEAWAGGIASAILIGAFAGLMPAVRASRMPPTVCCERHEREVDLYRGRRALARVRFQNASAVDAPGACGDNDRMEPTYHDESRRLQDRFDTRRLADRLDERFVQRNVIDAEDRAFIERMDMFFLATADGDGRPQCSYKGGDPGFVRVLDEHVLAFPNYDGNGMFVSLGNVLVNPKVGLLLIDFESPNRMRIEGLASLSDELTSMYAEAQSVTVVQVTRVFPNCPRYIHRMELVERSRFVPHQGVQTPVPDWKRSELAAGVLPAGDPAAQ